MDYGCYREANRWVKQHPNDGWQIHMVIDSLWDHRD